MIRDTLTTRWTDQSYLRTIQYRDSANLRARMGLHERFSSNPYGWFRWVFDQLVPPPGSDILELGCGPGRLWLENADRLGDIRRLVLSDYSLGMAHEARHALAPRVGAALNAANVDAQALPFADDSFDLVVANHMLYHVPDRPRAFAEIRRILRPGGRFCAATNGICHLQELDALIAGAPLAEARPFAGLPFSLEDGADQLVPFFPDTALVRYEDALIVTEAEPLRAYIRSMNRQGADDTRLAATVAELLARDGAIRITKDSGMFIGTK